MSIVAIRDWWIIHDFRSLCDDVWGVWVCLFGRLCYQILSHIRIIFQPHRSFITSQSVQIKLVRAINTRNFIIIRLHIGAQFIAACSLINLQNSNSLIQYSCNITIICYPFCSGQFCQSILYSVNTWSGIDTK